MNFLTLPHLVYELQPGKWKNVSKNSTHIEKKRQLALFFNIIMIISAIHDDLLKIDFRFLTVDAICPALP